MEIMDKRYSISYKYVTWKNIKNATYPYYLKLCYDAIYIDILFSLKYLSTAYVSSSMLDGEDTTDND